jgi:L-seryl-tRNA(Ser) seleniumtransferase
LAASFRGLPLPVIGRIHEGAFVLDLRVLEDEVGFAQQLQFLDIKRADGK